MLAIVLPILPENTGRLIKFAHYLPIIINGTEQLKRVNINCTYIGPHKYPTAKEIIVGAILQQTINFIRIIQSCVRKELVLNEKCVRQSNIHLQLTYF